SSPAPPADLSGTWKLDAARSAPTTAPFAGLSKSGAPDTIHVTATASGAIVVESEVNESQSRLYLPNQRSVTPVVPTGTITLMSRWEGRSLVGEGTLESASSAPTPVKETFAVAADARTLTVTIATGSPDKASLATLVYTRATTVEPCQKWPTPCKPTVQIR